MQTRRRRKTLIRDAEASRKRNRSENDDGRIPTMAPHHAPPPDLPSQDDPTNISPASAAPPASAAAVCPFYDPVSAVAGADCSRLDDETCALADPGTGHRKSLSPAQISCVEEPNPKRTLQGSSSGFSRSQNYRRDLGRSIRNAGSVHSSVRIVANPASSSQERILEDTCCDARNQSTPVPAPSNKKFNDSIDGYEMILPKQNKTWGSAFSRQRINSAKSRWKALTWRILEERNDNSTNEVSISEIVLNSGGGACSTKTIVPDPSSLPNQHICLNSACLHEQSSQTPGYRSIPQTGGCHSKLPERKKISLSSISRQKINSAKLRWRDLASRILKECSEISAKEASMNNMAENNDYSESRECVSAQGIRQKRTRIDQKQQGSPKKWRKSALKRRQVGVLKQLKQWLSNLKAFQGAAEENDSPPSRQTFSMAEDEREAFVHNMVEICQTNKIMRASLFKSVKVLVESGLMVFPAASLVHETSCEAAQNVLDAWQDLKQDTSSRLPTNFLHAVNQLHEKRDPSDKINPIGGRLSLSMDNEDRLWKFHIFSEDKPNLGKNICQ